MRRTKDVPNRYSFLRLLDNQPNQMGRVDNDEEISEEFVRNVPGNAPLEIKGASCDARLASRLAPVGTPHPSPRF